MAKFMACTAHYIPLALRGPRNASRRVGGRLDLEARRGGLLPILVKGVAGERG